MKHREAIAKPRIFNLEAIWRGFGPIWGHLRQIRGNFWQFGEVYGPFPSIFSQFEDMWIGFGPISEHFLHKFPWKLAIWGHKMRVTAHFGAFSANFGINLPKIGPFEAIWIGFEPILGHLRPIRDHLESLRPILGHFRHFREDYRFPANFRHNSDVWIHFGAFSVIYSGLETISGHVWPISIPKCSEMTEIWPGQAYAKKIRPRTMKTHPLM